MGDGMDLQSARGAWSLRGEREGKMMEKEEKKIEKWLLSTLSKHGEGARKASGESIWSVEQRGFRVQGSGYQVRHRWESR